MSASANDPARQHLNVWAVFSTNLIKRLRMVLMAFRMLGFSAGHKRSEDHDNRCLEMQCTTVGSHRCTLDLPKTNRIRTSHTKVVLLIFTVVVTTLLYVKDGSSVTGRSVRSLRKHPMANWNTSTPVGWDDSSITCRVPRFHPLDKGILDYYRPPPSRIVCKEREIKLSEMHLDSGELEILPTASLYSCFIEDVV